MSDSFEFRRVPFEGRGPGEEFLHYLDRILDEIDPATVGASPHLQRALVCFLDGGFGGLDRLHADETEVLRVQTMGRVGLALGLLAEEILSLQDFVAFTDSGADHIRLLELSEHAGDPSDAGGNPLLSQLLAARRELEQNVDYVRSLASYREFARDPVNLSPFWKGCQQEGYYAFMDWRSQPGTFDMARLARLFAEATSLGNGA